MIHVKQQRTAIADVPQIACTSSASVARFLHKQHNFCLASGLFDFLVLF